MFRITIDRIVYKIECGECLWEKSEDMKNKDNEKKMFTVFSRKASASALAPSAPIELSLRFSVVSVYERKVKMWRRKIRRRRCSPRFLEKRQLVLSLLQHRSYCLWDQVWWVSMQEKCICEGERSWRKRCSPCFLGKHQLVLWLLQCRFYSVGYWVW